MKTFGVEVAGNRKISELLEAGRLETDSHNLPVGLKNGAVSAAVQITK